MSHSFNPSSRQPFIEALIEMTNRLDMRGPTKGEPSLPKAKKIGLNNILWNQIMMMEETSRVRLTLELGANANFRSKGKSVLELAKALRKLYGSNEIVELLESYGAKATHKKRIGKNRPTPTN